jgi:hypothetical protein
MSTDTTQFVFQAPNAPEEYGVILPAPELRRLDFSALDFTNMMRACVEYIRTYHPNDFNDFYASNGLIMTLELVSYIADIITQRGDILIEEAFLPTSITKEAVINHLGLINQEIQRATPAVVDIEISVQNPLTTELRIPVGVSFVVTGPDGGPVTYEVFRSPGDFTSYISIPPGKRGIIGYGIEGKFGDPLIGYSNGGTDQYVDINYPNVLDVPITVEVKTGSESRIWRRVDIIEKSGPQDEVYEVQHLDNKTRITFGDNTAGKAPSAGDQITITYRRGGGVRGRIGAGIINTTRSLSPEPPSSAAIEVLFTNSSPSQGGTDEETIEEAKKRAPKEFATHNSAVTSQDYGVLAMNYRHPVFGAVSKAVGAIRTGVDGDIYKIADAIRAAPTTDDAVDIMTTTFVNRNIVEVYVLAEGPNNTPVTPNEGLKIGMTTYFTEKNVLTDEIRVLDGGIYYVDVQAVIVMSRNADPGTVKNAVTAALTDFFDLKNFDMGTPFYLSNLYNALQVVSGVKYVNIYEPTDDIILVDKVKYPDKKGIGFNEVIALGNVDLKYYFEQGSFRTPPIGKRV